MRITYLIQRTSLSILKFYLLLEDAKSLVKIKKITISENHLISYYIIMNIKRNSLYLILCYDKDEFRNCMVSPWFSLTSY